MLRRTTWPMVGLLTVALSLANYAVADDVWSLSFLGFGVVGSYVAWKVPDNATGLLMIGLSAVSAVSDSEVLGVVFPAAGWIGVAMPLLMGLFLLTFPSGHLSHRWWRSIVVAALGLTIAGFFVAQATGDEGPFVIVPLVAFVLGAAVDLMVRHRRSTGYEKAQMKYVVFATIASASLLVLPGLISSIGSFDISDVLYDLIVVFGFTLFPLAIGGAILRYRLYEIDRLISRTVSYSLVVVVLGLVFAAGVVWIPTALGLEDTPILVAASTLAVAALFNPLRRRIQRVVDRRFNRSRYQAEEVAEEFATKLQTSLTRHQLADIWEQTVDTHFEPSASGVWLRDD